MNLLNKVIEQLKTLPVDLQWRVLEFTRALTLAAPNGVHGQELIHFAGAISLEDVKQMQQDIEQYCERNDTNEW